MSTSYDLDRLRLEKEAAFKAKQTAWGEYAATRTEEYRELVETAYAAMVAKWKKLEAAGIEVNNVYLEVWGNHDSVYENNVSIVQLLREEADREYKQMQDCFKQAAREYSGNGAKSVVLAAEGREHKKRLKELNIQIRKCCDELAARRKAVQESSKIDSPAYEAARAVYTAAKADYENAKSEFLRLKEERNHRKEIYLTAKGQFKSVKKQYKLAVKDFEDG